MSPQRPWRARKKRKPAQRRPTPPGPVCRGLSLSGARAERPLARWMMRRPNKERAARAAGLASGHRVTLSDGTSSDAAGRCLACSVPGKDGGWPPRAANAAVHHRTNVAHRPAANPPASVADAAAPRRGSAVACHQADGLPPAPACAVTTPTVPSHAPLAPCPTPGTRPHGRAARGRHARSHRWQPLPRLSLPLPRLPAHAAGRGPPPTLLRVTGTAAGRRRHRAPCHN